MNRYVVVSICVLAVVLVAAYGVHSSAKSNPDFWKSFVPNLWANVIGVSVAATIGIPIGFAINHYFITITEHRHHGRQIEEVRQLLEQVKLELDLHSATLFRLRQIFTGVAAATTFTLASPTAAMDVSILVLQEVFGKQLIGNHSVLEIGESLILFQIGSYYERVGELNRHITWRIQDTQQPERWDTRIAALTDSVSLSRIQTEYEIQQAVIRLRQTA